MFVCIPCVKKELSKRGIKEVDQSKYYTIALNSGNCCICGAKKVPVDWVEEKEKK